MYAHLTEGGEFTDGLLADRPSTTMAVMDEDRSASVLGDIGTLVASDRHSGPPCVHAKPKVDAKTT